MTSKKLYVKTDNYLMIVLYQDNYNTHLDKFDAMYKILKYTFPGIKRKDVQIKVYGGDCIRHIPGLECSVSKHLEPIALKDGYQEIHNLPCTIG